MKVFYIDGVDWWIGESEESVRAALKAEQNFSDADLEDMRECTDDEMGDSYYDVDGACSRTFAEQVQQEIKEGGEFPRLFATTEY